MGKITLLDGLIKGYSINGLPFTKIGSGPKPLIVFEGLTFENKPQPATMVKMYAFLQKNYSIYSVLRRPQMPKNYTLDDMANDYASMIEQEFETPVDIIGLSTGGSIALHFAALHPHLVRRLVIHSSAYKLNDRAKQLQLNVATCAMNGKWRKAWSLLIASCFPQKGILSYMTKPFVFLGSVLLSVKNPKDANDLVVTVKAEDKHNFLDQLGEITCPTLVAGGVDDYFYSPELFEKTANGIPNAKLCLYEKMGHPASGRQFRMDVSGFLLEV